MGSLFEYKSCGALFAAAASRFDIFYLNQDNDGSKDHIQLCHQQLNRLLFFLIKFFISIHFLLKSSGKIPKSFAVVKKNVSLYSNNIAALFISI